MRAIVRIGLDTARRAYWAEPCVMLDAAAHDLAGVPDLPRIYAPGWPEGIAYLDSPETWAASIAHAEERGETTIRVVNIARLPMSAGEEE